MFDFSGMNENQIQAVEASDGPVLIIAGPGTGKTFTLVKRIAYLVSEKNVNPSEIMAVTFTEKAARELLTRISNEFTALGIDENINDMYIGTFHSIALRIMKELPDCKENNRRILDSFETTYLICRNISRFKYLRGFEEHFPDSMGVWKQSMAVCRYVSRLLEELADIDAMPCVLVIDSDGEGTNLSVDIICVKDKMLMEDYKVRFYEIISEIKKASERTASETGFVLNPDGINEVTENNELEIFTASFSIKEYEDDNEAESDYIDFYNNDLNECLNKVFGSDSVRDLLCIGGVSGKGMSVDELIDKGHVKYYLSLSEGGEKDNVFAVVRVLSSFGSNISIRIVVCGEAGTDGIGKLYMNEDENGKMIDAERSKYWVAQAAEKGHTMARSMLMFSNVWNDDDDDDEEDNDSVEIDEDLDIDDLPDSFSMDEETARKLFGDSLPVIGNDDNEDEEFDEDDECDSDSDSPVLDEETARRFFGMGGSSDDDDFDVDSLPKSFSVDMETLNKIFGSSDPSDDECEDEE